MAAGLVHTERYSVYKQVQSKLAFKPTPKDKQPPEAAEATRVTGAANRVVRATHVKRNRRAAPAPAQLLRCAEP